MSSTAIPVATINPVLAAMTANPSEGANPVPENAFLSTVPIPGAQPLMIADQFGDTTYLGSPAATATTDTTVTTSTSGLSGAMLLGLLAAGLLIWWLMSQKGAR